MDAVKFIEEHRRMYKVAGKHLPTNTPYQDQNNDLINRRFDEQNKILEELNVILARLLELLGGKE